MSSCCIKWCGKSSRNSNYKTDGITFHRFPKDPELKEKWIELTKRENWFPSKTRQVCSRHFTEDCFHIMKCGRRRLYDTAIPTKYLPLMGDTTATKLNVQTQEQDCPEPSSSTLNVHLIPMTPKTETITPSQFRSPTEKKLCRRILELSEKIKVKDKKLSILRNKARYFKKREPYEDVQSDSSPTSDPTETRSASKRSKPNVGQRRLSVTYVCKSCLQNSSSFRYRCLVCPDYEMCGECEGRGGHHDDHYVLRVPMQCPTVEVDKVESEVRRALSSFSAWRFQWLRLISREDLTHGNISSHRVCEVHFNSQDIQVNKIRKTLKKHSMPCLHVPTVTKEDKQTQVDIMTVNTASQTDISDILARDSCQTEMRIASDDITQTAASLTANTPRTRKLKSELLDSKKRLRAHEKELTCEKSQQDMFYKLCDRFLSKDLAEIVKAQMNMKSSHIGNRNKAFKSTAKPKAARKKRSKKVGNKPIKTRNSEDSREDTENDSEDTEDEPSETDNEPSDDEDDPNETKKKPEITLHKPGTIKTEAVISDDEPEVKEELFIKEEVDPLEEEAAASAFPQEIFEHQTPSGSKDVSSPPSKLVIKEEVDILEEDVAASAFPQEIYERQLNRGSKDVLSTHLVPPPSKSFPPFPSSYAAQTSQGVPSFYLVPLIQGGPPPQSDPSCHIAQASQVVPSSILVPLIQGTPQSQTVPPCKVVLPSKGDPPSKLVASPKDVPPSQRVPPSKRRRGDEPCSTTTTHSHKTTPTSEESTELCTETSSSSRVATSSKPGSKVDVFVLKKRTLPVDENDDL